MCGIVGLFYRDPDRTVSERTVRAMCAAIVHRGPDDEGVFVDRNFGMGMRRLSIIDLEGGHQPIFNEDRSVGVVYNGELYNHPDLKSELEVDGHRYRTKSDTESLVHGYEKWGVELPEHLNGMFAFSIWDARERRVLLVRDHVGVKPLYLYEDDRVVAWASEIKALLRVPEVVRRLDMKGLRDFLALGYVPAPRTLFGGVRKVLPATRLTIDAGGTRAEAYWDLSFAPEERESDAWCEELRHLVDDAVRRQLMSDVPLGAFLSGGIDSSSIVATMRRLGVGKISTYAIGFTGEDEYHSELDKASLVARRFETDHHEIVVEPDVADLMHPLMEHLDEPVTDTSFIVTYLVSKLARESVTVILSGVGGDEVFGGYRRYLWPHLQRLYDRVPGFLDRGVIRPILRHMPVDRGSRVKALARYARGFLDHADKPPPERYRGYVGVFTDGQLEGLLQDGVAAELREAGPTRIEHHYRAAGAVDPLNAMLYADLKTSLVDSLLAFTDKMSMAVSLEARVPLLDRRIVEQAARIPPSLKIQGRGDLKHIFKKAMGDRLPPEIIHQKKKGFGTPISRWFRGSLRPLLTDLLSPERVRRRGLFRTSAVEGMIEDHMNQRADHSEHLMALLAFEIWSQVHMDGKGG